MKIISIPTNGKRFYRQFLEVLRSVPPISKLRPKELDVLAEIMYQNDKYKDLDIDVRYTMIFSTKIRIEMRDNVKIGEDSFNNNLSILRKLKILSKGNQLNSFLDTVIFDDNYNLNFEFKNKQ